MDVEIVRNPAASEYELLLDGERIGELEYIRTGDVLKITHTVVAQEYSGLAAATGGSRMKTSRRTASSCFEVPLRPRVHRQLVRGGLLWCRSIAVTVRAGYCLTACRV